MASVTGEAAVSFTKKELQLLENHGLELGQHDLVGECQTPLRARLGEPGRDVLRDVLRSLLRDVLRDLAPATEGILTEEDKKFGIAFPTAWVGATWRAPATRRGRLVNR